MVPVTGLSMRRHASEWAVGRAATKQPSFWVPRASCSLKATAVSAVGGEPRFAPSGVFAYGTLEEDGPGTWEALILPCGPCDRVGHRLGTTGAAANESEGVGGLYMSVDAYSGEVEHGFRAS